MKSILIPRQAHQAASMIQAVKECGYLPVHVPLIETQPPADIQALNDAHNRHYDWIIFSSANAVRAWCTQPFQADALAVVGKNTARVLEEYGYQPTLIAPKEASHAAGLVRIFPKGEGSVLLPQADIAGATLAQGLKNLGWSVHVVEAYRTRARQLSEEEKKKIASVSAIAFTSGSTVRSYYQAMGAVPHGTIIGSIGPTTTAVCKEYGFTVDVEPVHASAPALIQAIAEKL